jgi:hypothetical protein
MKVQFTAQILLLSKGCQLKKTQLFTWHPLRNTLPTKKQRPRTRNRCDINACFDQTFLLQHYFLRKYLIA